ncbi:MAG TPA: Holliday junction branch migration protein RuvA [Fimbriimonadaceae bacterium]
MIGHLRGTLLESEGGFVLVECGGVGYEVLVPESVMMQLPPTGVEVSLRIRQIFREDGVTLYGFTEIFQRRLFDLLLTVKGCGPKIGLALIGQLGEEGVAGAILAEDARALARANGVGARLAERIILELKDKMATESLMRKITDSSNKRMPMIAPDDDLVDALMALGYRRPEAESAARDAREESEDLQSQIKIAVGKLSPAKTQGGKA